MDHSKREPGSPGHSTDAALESASSALFRAAPIPAWIYDLETLRFLEVNDAAVAHYGWTREEFLAMTLLDIRPEAEHDRLRDAVGQVPDGIDRAGVWRHLTRSGDTLDVEIHSHALVFNGRPAELVFVHDISQRVRDERALRSTGERLQALLRAMPGVVILLDEDGRFIEGSGEEGLLVVPPTQFVGRHIGDFFPPEQTREFVSTIQRALEADRPLDYAYELDVEDGHVHFEARVSPLRSRIQGRRAVVWVAWDVTQRHHAMQALRESETRLRTILDSEPECVKVIDPAGKVISMNRAGLRMLGVSRVEDVSRPMDFVAPHDRAAFLKLHSGALAGHPGELSFDAIRGDGTTLRFHSTAVPMRDASGVIVATLVITRDVTEARRLSRAFEEQAELLKSIFDFIPIMIGVIDAGGRLTFPNRAFTNTLGWTADALRGDDDPFGEIFPDAAVRHEAEAFFQNPAEAWREYGARARDGRDLRVAWTAVRLSDGRRILIGQDVTEQRRLEARTWQSQKLESIGRLAGGVAHDFNNMLTVILGYVELLIMREALEGTTRSDIENVREAALRARDLTAQLLAFGRRQVTRRRATAVERVVTGISPLMRRVLGEDIALEIRGEANGALVLADPAQLEQILMNLVLNARDAMPRGGRVTIETSRIDLPAGEDAPHGMGPGRYVRVRVSDTGHGMDAATLERVFEPFFTTKGMTSGTGLGLATVYGAVQQNGGTIFASSAPGKGATFEIFFPVADGGAGAPVDVAPAAPPRRGRGEVVLVVEDDSNVRGFVVRVLRESGYAVLEANSVATALRAAEEAKSVDLVLSDMVMSDGGGLDVLRAVEERHPRARQLLVSGYAESDAIRTHLIDPAVNFLQKPFTPEALLGRVRELLQAGAAPAGGSPGDVNPPSAMRPR